MSAGAASTPGASRPEPVASLRHTLVVVGIFALLAAAGTALQARPGGGANLVATHPPALPLYFSVIASEWALVYYVRIGLRRRGARLRDLIGGAWDGGRPVLRDLALGAVAWAGMRAIGWTMEHLVGDGGAKSISTLLPQGGLEAMAWVALSLSAGFCEELVFRGYLLRQARAFLGHPVLAVLAQAVVFGIGHGYQGATATLTIVLDGVWLGAIAAWRRSLRPGMLAHAWTDIVGGLWSR